MGPMLDGRGAKKYPENAMIAYWMCRNKTFINV